MPMLSRIALVFLLLAAGCASVVPAPDPAPRVGLWQDAQFKPVTLPDAEAVFAIDDDMRRYLRHGIARQLRDLGKLNGLIAALEHHAQLKLDYDARVTRTASETFVARKGNCLSLTLMTAALARELGLQVRFRKVFTHEPWDRRNGLLVSSGHVNIALEPGLGDQSLRNGSAGVIIDFLPGADVRGYRSVNVDETTILGMYMNNRAVENIAAGNLDEAYAWAKQAITTAPRFIDSQNTLGVIYLRRNLLRPAALSFEQVLQREADNVTALANLSEVLTREGDLDGANRVSARLTGIEAVPPFFHFDRGMEALKIGDYATATGLFQQELNRNDAYAPAYFAQALAYLRLGNEKRARVLLEQAQKYAEEPGDRDIYAGKLAWLDHKAKRAN